MKKILALLAILAFAITLTACGSASGDEKPPFVPTPTKAPATTTDTTPVTTAPPPAPAANAETLFLDTLATQGVTYTASDADMVNLGYAVCQDEANGVSQVEIGTTIMDAAGFSSNDAATIVIAAEDTVCAS